MSRMVNLDSNESIFFSRQLEKVKAKTYDVVYPTLQAQQVIPVSTEAGPGAASITYRQFDMVGIAKVISNYAKDLPSVSAKAKEFTVTVKSLGASYEYSIQDIRSAAQAGTDLSGRLANAARFGIEKKIDDIAWKAYATDGENAGLVGLLYNANVTKGAVATRGGHVTWATKTNLEILADLNAGCTGIKTLTNDCEYADTVCLPTEQYGLISTTPLQSGSDTTILEFFLKAHQEIKSVRSIACLNDVNPVPSTGAASNTDCMIFLNSSPDKLTLEIPQPFEQFEAQVDGLQYKVPCHARCAGVIAYYPLSVAIYEGI